jgi:hypothetical protein
VHGQFQLYKSEGKRYLTFVRSYSVHCLGANHSLHFSTFPFRDMFCKRNDKAGFQTLTVTCVCVCVCVCRKPDCLYIPKVALFCTETNSVATNHYALRNKLAPTNICIPAPEGKQRTLSIQQHFSDISHTM